MKIIPIVHQKPALLKKNKKQIVKLSDEIRNTFFSNYVQIQHQVTYADGTVSGWSPMVKFNDCKET